MVPIKLVRHFLNDFLILIITMFDLLHVQVMTMMRIMVTIGVDLTLNLHVKLLLKGIPMMGMTEPTFYAIFLLIISIPGTSLTNLI